MQLQMGWAAAGAVGSMGGWASFMASIGAFMGFLVTTLLKLIASGSLLYIILSRIF